MRWLRLRLCKRAMDEMYAERLRLARAVREQKDPFHPTVGEQHTRGMYEGLSRAIEMMETHYR